MNVDKPMRRMFEGEGIDRGLVRGIVKTFAKVRGMEYEQAHAYLSARAAKMQPFTEVSPDSLLREGEIISRNNLRAIYKRLRLAREHFTGSTTPDDERGYIGDYRE